MNFWEELNNRIKENGELWDATRNVYKFIRTLMEEGSFEVITPFKYKKNDLQYRTVIHADADVYNYIPAFPQKEVEHEKFIKLSKKIYKQHTKKVGEVFTMFDSTKRFWEKLVDYSLVFINTGPAAFAITESSLQDITPALYSIGSIAFSILLRPWLKNKAVSMAFKIGMRIVKKYVKI